ncbi:formin-like protein 6 isoform X2 [Asparagus officinalis]|nr:formin-like protein 6 isoform X2 [Asparagus officinalis]
MVFNFREGEHQSQIADILSEYDMTVMDYPRHYEGCPLLTMEMIHHFLKSSESWLSLDQQNVLLMHCERGGWPVLSFMLAGLLIYRKQYTGEQKTLDMIYKQAPCELLQLLSPLNPLPSQLRYLQYISRRNVGSKWPPLDRALTLDCIILRILPNFDGDGGCRPIFRIYGQDPLLVCDRTPKVLFSIPKKSKSVRLYKQADCELVKIDIHCHIQGDVVLECITLDEDLEREQMMFRVMFNTAFIRSNILMLNRDEIDILWDAKDRFPKDFRAEVLFSEMDAAASVVTVGLANGDEKEGLPVETFARVREIFSSIDWVDGKGDTALHVLQKLNSSNVFQEKLNSVSPKKVENELLPKLSPEMLKEKVKLDEVIDRITSLSPFDSKQQPIPFQKQSLDSETENQDIKHQDLQLSLQHPSLPTTVSQRVPKSWSNSVPSINSLQSSLVHASRYHSAPSALGITALLQDHTSIEVAHSVTMSTSSPTLADVASYGLSEDVCTKISLPSAALAEPKILSPPLRPSLTQVSSAISSTMKAPITPPSLLSPTSPVQSPEEPPNPELPPSKLTKPSARAPPPPPPRPPPPPSSYNHGTLSIAASPEIHINSRVPPSHFLPSGGKSIPPTPPPPVSSTPPPPPPPPFIFSSTPVPPPPPIKRSCAPSPPPPPLSGPTSSGTSPPPPPQLSSKHSGGSIAQKLPNGQAVPPPPLGHSLLKGSSADSSQPSSLGSRGAPPPPNGMNGPIGASLGAKGRISRTSSRQSAQSSSKKASLKPLHWVKVTRAMQGSLWAETQKPEEASKAPEFDMSELESLFSAAVPKSDLQGSSDKSRRLSLGQKPNKVHLIDLRRANNCEIMLTKVKMPLTDLMSSVLALDDSVLDGDQVDNLIKFCPTKEEMELLKGFGGDKESLGKCEQYFLELMNVPRVESKLRVFSFKIQFHTQVADLSSNLNVVNSSAGEIRGSVKLKRIMQTILSLGNALNQGTARGSAIGFRLDSLLKLTDTRARNNRMTLMHYLCKVLADKLPELLDFPKDLVNLEAASKIMLKTLAEEMQAISKGLEKVEQELAASENDGPISETFRKTLKEFLVGAEAEVRALTSFYSNVGRNADALALYFGEDPARCPFEQVISTLLNFVKMFIRAHEENCKQLELEKKKARKEAENEKMKLSAQKREQESLPYSPSKTARTR